MAHPKKFLATIEIHYVQDGALVRKEYVEKMLFWAGERKGWYFNDLSGNKNFLTLREPLAIERVIGNTDKTGQES